MLVGLDRSVLRTSQNAVQLRPAVDNLRSLIRPRLVHAQNLCLGPKHVLLDPETRGVTLPDDVRDLTPGAAAVFGQLTQGAREEILVVGAPNPRLDGEAGAFDARLSLFCSLRGFFAGQTELPRPWERLRDHRPQKRHVPLAQRESRAVVLVIEGEGGVRKGALLERRVVARPPPTRLRS